MRAFFKPAALTGALLATALTVGACSQAEQTPDTLIVGQWTQSAPIEMTEQGMTIAMSDGYTTYDADGTSTGGVTMVLQGMPEAMARYKVEGTGTWTIEDNMLVEEMTTVDVTAQSDNMDAIGAASQMEAGMRAQTTSRNEIKTLTQDELVLYQAENDLTMSYTR